MNTPEIFYFPTQLTKKGTLKIYEVGDCKPGQDPKINLHLGDVIFINRGELAEDLFTLGITRKLLKEGKDVILECNPADVDKLRGHHDPRKQSK